MRRCERNIKRGKVYKEGKEKIKGEDAMKGGKGYNTGLRNFMRSTQGAEEY